MSEKQFKHICGYGLSDVQPSCTCYEDFINLRLAERLLATKKEIGEIHKTANDFARWIAKNEFYTHNENCFTSRILDGKTFVSDQLFNMYLETLYNK